MSAFKVADKACEKINSNNFQFIILNFANMDMVGHTGIVEAAIKACETVDKCVQQVVQAIWATGGTALITADHGNSEQMIADDGSPQYSPHLKSCTTDTCGRSLLKKHFNKRWNSW